MRNLSRPKGNFLLKIFLYRFRKERKKGSLSLRRFSEREGVVRRGISKDFKLDNREINDRGTLKGL